MMNKDLFEGVITPMVTPLIDRENIDFKGLEKLQDHLINGGVSGVFLMGTTGEGTSISPRMRKDLIKYSIEYVKGRVPVFVSIADCCIEESLNMARYAKECGVTYLVSALPFYLGLTQKEIIDYYTTIADNVPLPLFLYNIPAQTKLMISVEAVKTLAKHPNIIGMKDSSGNGTYFNTLLAEIKAEYPNFTILVGPDEMLASTMAMGGNGGVNSGSNLFPELYINLFKACKAKDTERILKLQKLVMKVSTGVYSVDKSSVSFLKGLKAALFTEGLITDYICEPLQKVNNADLETIRKNVAELKQQIIQVL
ncbi:dihydrodipicolinate synthase family protein [Bacteroides xylanisolvens]|jgi:dihydrodipicolinate synthase/N-acetylneuraminate lyase|uniref:dihydrodipicolinate synthase family protein n=1 Tax=Bacteroides TaxID=816 RepID=UPI001F408F88|nr:MULTISPECIES: dihydrodipicolinate synthase family protein [Bacteroides]